MGLYEAGMIFPLQLKVVVPLRGLAEVKVKFVEFSKQVLVIRGWSGEVQARVLRSAERVTYEGVIIETLV